MKIDALRQCRTRFGDAYIWKKSSEIETDVNVRIVGGKCLNVVSRLRISGGCEIESNLERTCNLLSEKRDGVASATSCSQFCDVVLSIPGEPTGLLFEDLGGQRSSRFEGTVICR